MNGKVERTPSRRLAWAVLRRPQRLLMRCLCALMLVAVPGVAVTSSSVEQAAQAEQSPPAAATDHLADDQMLVRELMRAEAALALSLMRDERVPVRRAQEGRPLAPDRAMSLVTRPVLQGIYGVGKRLLAEVQWQGETYIYLNGRALPVGRVADPKVYLLQAIQSRCVQLARGDARVTLCLDHDSEKG
ncbi:hypothetical protein [Pusillimonas minor]|uniref:Type IV pilus biogenesis protein PilP n=1 Tax=Pusillimonas minor TaxID=2697024 RepID=A0A842HN69_9BURK|nr:hypothetical protein [Pusillimonas minor]MBC2770309.1 hypothetical protein [Pusillimonas minor]